MSGSLCENNFILLNVMLMDNYHHLFFNDFSNHLLFIILLFQETKWEVGMNKLSWALMKLILLMVTSKIGLDDFMMANDNENA